MWVLYVSSHPRGSSSPAALEVALIVITIITDPLCRPVRECLPVALGKSSTTCRDMMRPLDLWRASLATTMHVEGTTGSNICYLHAQALSYRFECMLCRMIRRRSQPSDWVEWANQRLRSAIVELDTIALRVSASGTFHKFPVSL
jgi:hypothetical protein